MITITRKGLTLSIDSSVIPAQGSSQVQVKFINDNDEYNDFKIQPSIGWYDTKGIFKATLCVFKDSFFYIPSQAFAQAGNIYFSIGLVDPLDPSHIEKTLQTQASVSPAPVGTVILPSDDAWTNFVKEYMEELFNTEYQNKFNELFEEVNNSLENGDFVPEIIMEASVDDTSGTPQVSVLKEGDNKRPRFILRFTGLKGKDGTGGGGGEQYVLPIMTDVTLGGGKAIKKTDESVPVAVDEDGKLWVPAQQGGGLPLEEIVYAEDVLIDIKLDSEVASIEQEITPKKYSRIVFALLTVGTATNTAKQNVGVFLNSVDWTMPMSIMKQLVSTSATKGEAIGNIELHKGMWVSSSTVSAGTTIPDDNTKIKSSIYDKKYNNVDIDTPITKVIFQTEGEGVFGVGTELKVIGIRTIENISASGLSVRYDPETQNIVFEE